MNKKTKKRIVIWSIVGVVVIAVILILVLGKSKRSNVMLETSIARIDSLETTVTATGEIQPVYKVDVGTQVSGIVEKLYVDYNSVVKKGDLLAELDRSTLSEQVNQAQASLSNAESALTLAKQNYDRIKALYDNKAATQEAYEQASNEYVQAQNQVVTAKSNYQQAQVNLSYSLIYSPIDGVVLSKEVEEGQTVASSYSTPTLITIANDLKQMQVEADVDEADIGQVKEGQLVTFTVDAYPDDQFSGTVRQIRLEPTETSNVVTYTVIIDAPNEEEKLLPGMTANVSIIISKKSGISIPVESLYFSLSDETKNKLTKSGSTFNAQPEEEVTKTLKDVTRKMIWVKEGNTYTQRSVSTGTDDGAKCIILDGIKEGEEVVVGERTVSSAEKPGESASNPFMPGHPEEKTR